MEYVTLTNELYWVGGELQKEHLVCKFHSTATVISFLTLKSQMSAAINELNFFIVIILFYKKWNGYVHP